MQVQLCQNFAAGGRPGVGSRGKRRRPERRESQQDHSTGRRPLHSGGAVLSRRFSGMPLRCITPLRRRRWYMAQSESKRIPLAQHRDRTHLQSLCRQHEHVAALQIEEDDTIWASGGVDFTLAGPPRNEEVSKCRRILPSWLINRASEEGVAPFQHGILFDAWRAVSNHCILPVGHDK